MVTASLINDISRAVRCNAIEGKDANGQRERAVSEVDVGDSK